MKSKNRFKARYSIVIALALALSLAVANNMTGGHTFYTNLNALSRDEIEGSHGTGKCWNSITNSEGEFVLYCGSCTYLKGHHAWLSGSGECY